MRSARLYNLFTIAVSVWTRQTIFGFFMRSNLDFKMRLFKIDQMISEGDGVSFEAMLLALRCSAPTLKRDLRYMREKLRAPIVYSNKKRGYIYASQDAAPGMQSLPAKWYTPDEIFTLMTCLQLFDKVAANKGGLMAGEMGTMKSRLLTLLQGNKDHASEVMRRIKVVLPFTKDNGGACFQEIGQALLARKRLRIRYQGANAQLATDRELSPLRLVNYRGRWYIDAWDHGSDRLKTFRLAKILAAEPLPRNARIVPMRNVTRELDSGYGIFSGAQTQTAEVFIDAFMGAYVKDEVWHPDQQMDVHEDGSLVLRVPYSKPDELLGRILSLGPHATVLQPSALRRMARDELQETLKNYSPAKNAATSAKK